MTNPSTNPTEFYWSGEAMVPTKPAVAAARYVDGEVYTLAPWVPRSRKSHDHYFSVVDDAWENLPEELALRFATPEHLRKWALIRSGHCESRTVVTETDDEAIKLGGFIRSLDEYALVQVIQNTVSVWVAKSQSLRAMGRATFEQSKTDVINVLAEMIGVDPETLRTQGGMSA